MNEAFGCVFDGHFKGAIEFFRQVNGLTPANPVAVNNIATCHVFNNDAGKALDTLIELIKMDTPNAVSE